MISFSLLNQYSNPYLNRLKRKSISSPPLPPARSSSPPHRMSLPRRHEESMFTVEGDFLGEVGVPALGLGLAALGRPGYINLNHALDLAPCGSKQVDDLRRHTHEICSHAHNLQLRYFDTARSYGMAEEFLSSWLTSIPSSSSNILIGSKWGYTYTADWSNTNGAAHEVKEHSLRNLLKQSKETKALLGDRLNLYQIHSATLGNSLIPSWKEKNPLSLSRPLSLSPSPHPHVPLSLSLSLTPYSYVLKLSVSNMSPPSLTPSPLSPHPKSLVCWTTTRCWTSWCT